MWVWERVVAKVVKIWLYKYHFSIGKRHVFNKALGEKERKKTRCVFFYENVHEVFGFKNSKWFFINSDFII